MPIIQKEFQIFWIFFQQQKNFQHDNLSMQTTNKQIYSFYCFKIMFCKHYYIT